MKLLVFAHTPPPHHGQSYMVELMLGGLPAHGITPVHINSRLSSGMEDIGTVRGGKLLLLLRYCGQAIRTRFREKVTTFYYIPAPGKRSALYRDWLVMVCCRPFFPRLVLHWHAMGLAEWLERDGKPFERTITRLLLGRPALSIVLAEANRNDARWLNSRQTVVVPNGIPDPCPEFDTTLLPARNQRLRGRQSGTTAPYRLLFLAHCTAEKGLFDALRGVALHNAQFPAAPAHLTVAGAFLDDRERKEFDRLLDEERLHDSVRYVGFVSGADKARLLGEADALCFPTRYHAESFGLVVAEAMAYGCLPLVTRWRSIPELLPVDYPAFVPEHDPSAIAAMIRQMQTLDLARPLRQRFLDHYRLEPHLARLAAALRPSA